MTAIFEKFLEQAIVFNDVPDSKFYDHRWQTKNTIQGKPQLIDFLKKVYPAGSTESAEILGEVSTGMRRSSMSIKISPYVLSRINWNTFFSCPVRKQFIPVDREILPDHPAAKLDSLDEQHDSPVEGLVHRYPHKVLFLSLSVCPVYCRFCTRSYSVGNATESVEDKASVKPSITRLDRMYEYIRQHKEVNDVVVSGGDTYMLSPDMLYTIGHTLLNIETVKCVRFATKGIAVMPMKIMSDEEWTGKIIELSNYGRSIGKQVMVHTHINHPNEISKTTREACDLLFKNGVMVRDQSVLMRTVNDDSQTMYSLLSEVASMNVYPYYIFQADIVPGQEYFRTPLSTIVELEKQLRGRFSGFQTPAFVVDLMGGGGKRVASSYESYDLSSGISTFMSPAIDSERMYYHFDPLHSLSREGRESWMHHADQYMKQFHNFER